ncbi:MAG: L-lysine 6-transaminase [Chlorobiaceae bacterium]|nr:L-lysine 6-transaminase [Chlorobiaceae bacterium]MBA4308779.1 L-lysine 6-transaminase [Chlorobiaceae bacterium]
MSTQETVYKKQIGINPDNVHKTLANNMLVDGFDIVLDLENSYDRYLVDQKTGDKYLDFFSFFASNPLGMNHPKLMTPEFRDRLATAAVNKPSNSDIYTCFMAEFVNTFSVIVKPEHFKYLFFVEGGSVGVENGLKVAFDWKVQKNFKKGYKEEKGTKVIHFREAFHGRTGYTLSLTNTDPAKINYFPKFDWPRISNPKIKFPLAENLEFVIKAEEIALQEIHNAIKNNVDDIAAIIIEPIQSEGGDNYFRKEFLLKLREIADANEILLMFDEVQTGIGITGKMWAAEHYVMPDIISFGKKVQLAGIMVSDRIDDIEENVFRKSSRINSTWGGNLVDMVRSQKILEVIYEENLIENAKNMGAYLLSHLEEMQSEFSAVVSNTRGLGLMCSFDFVDKDHRKEFLDLCYKNKLMMLGCGSRSVRFRTPLTVTKDDLDMGLKIIRDVLSYMRNHK